MVIGVGLGFVAQFTGVNGFMYYTPIILKSTGLGTSASIAATIGNGVVSVLATFVGIWAISLFRRRTMLIFVMTMVPETRGKSLEEIESHMKETFGGTAKEAEAS